MAGYSGSKDDYLRRLKRIEGQVRGVARMVDEDVVRHEALLFRMEVRDLHRLAVAAAG